MLSYWRKTKQQSSDIWKENNIGFSMSCVNQRLFYQMQIGAVISNMKVGMNRHYKERIYSLKIWWNDLWLMKAFSGKQFLRFYWTFNFLQHIKVTTYLEMKEHLRNIFIKGSNSVSVSSTCLTIAHVPLLLKTQNIYCQLLFLKKKAEESSTAFSSFWPPSLCAGQQYQQSSCLFPNSQLYLITCLACLLFPLCPP